MFGTTDFHNLAIARTLCGGTLFAKFSNIHSTFLDKADAERVVPGVLMTEQ